MPFYLYEIRHVLDDGNDSRLYEAGFWSPTLESADEHLHTSMAEAATKQADHIESDTGTADVDVLDDGSHGFWITWDVEGDVDRSGTVDAEHHERLMVCKPAMYETPEEMAAARSPERTVWEIGDDK